MNFDSSANIYSTDIAIRVDDKNDEFVGIIKIVLNISETINIIKNTKESSTKYKSRHFTLLDKNGKYLYSTSVYKFFQNAPYNLKKQLKLKSKGSSGYFIIDGNNKGPKKLFAYAHSKGYKTFKGFNWVLFIDHETKEIFKPVTRIRNALLFITFIILLLASLIDFSISHSISVPLIKLKDAAIEIGKGSLHSKINISSKDEIGELAISFTNMSKALEKSRDELLFAKEYTENILKFMIDTLIVIDMENNILSVNKATIELLGYKSYELIGKPFSVIFSHDDILRDTLFQNIMDKGSITNKEVLYKTKNKRFIPMLLSGSIIKNKQGVSTGVVCIAKDITDRKKAEIEQRKYETQMQHTQKLESIGILAGGIAHDFNNILTAIVANISLTKMYISPKEESYETIIDAEKATLQAKTLTKQLLTFSKGGVPIKKLTSLEDLIKDTASFALRGSHIGSALSIPDDLWSAEIDAGQIGQVINNLIINAIQSMQEGGKINITAENIHMEENSTIQISKGKYIKISISDQGTGIEKQNLKKIFDPYFSTKEQGSGLGLTTTYYIIKNHMGHIKVESEKDNGTTFSIYLPASDKKALNKTTSHTQITGGKGKILLMDDEEPVLKSVGKMLTFLGYDATLAKNGEIAIDLYKKTFENNDKFDAVIMDLTIPGGMGGKAATKKILKIDTKAKIIVSSGYSNDPVMADYKKFGFCAIMVKPYGINEIDLMLKKIIRQTL
ncbi:MAG: PAS domain S-box protein [Candidatus Aureabacteria bacterium]|nr:PAS domain S-box protein [Candidatus Auribacterota bacterium]